MDNMLDMELLIPGYLSTGYMGLGEKERRSRLKLLLAVLQTIHSKPTPHSSSLHFPLPPFP
jgi:hypothetical protein